MNDPNKEAAPSKEISPDIVIEEHFVAEFTGRLTSYKNWRWPHTKKSPAPFIIKGHGYVMQINTTKGITRLIPVVMP
jgi:hypothetical protein